MTRLRYLFSGFLLMILVAPAFTLELTNGKIRIDLSENSGRFIAYYHASASAWTPLFYAPDPRTSVLEILAGQSLYRMGDSSRFKQTVTKTQTGGGEITWTSNQLSVSEAFAFRTSTGASQADGFLITIQIVNKSQKPLSVGARYLIDTALGEQRHIEFATPSQSSMSNETQFKGADIPAYWVSPLDNRMTVALETVLRSPGVTLPDRIIFANWKRLNESGWDYTVDTSRNFNMLPYSINDSAVAMYYDPETLQSGEARTITLLMGQYSSAGWSEAPAASTASTASTAPAPAQPSSSITQLLNAVNTGTEGTSGGSTAPAAGQAATSVLSDLKTVDGVLQEIQKMLDTPGEANQTDLDGLRQVLDKLNARKNQLPQK